MARPPGPGGRHAERDFLRSGHGGALRLSADPKFKGKIIVAILPDAGERYLSGALFEGLFAEVEKMQAVV